MPRFRVPLLITYLAPGVLLLAVLWDALRVYIGQGPLERPTSAEDWSILAVCLLVISYGLGLLLYNLAYSAFQGTHRLFREIVMVHDLSSNNLSRLMGAVRKSLMIKFPIKKNPESYLKRFFWPILFLTDCDLPELSPPSKATQVLIRYFPIAPCFGIRKQLSKWHKEYYSAIKNDGALSYNAFNIMRTATYIYSGVEWVGRFEHSWQFFRTTINFKWAAFFVHLHCLLVFLFSCLGVINPEGCIFYLAGAIVFWGVSWYLNCHSWNRHRTLARDCVVGFCLLSIRMPKGALVYPEEEGDIESNL